MILPLAGPANRQGRVAAETVAKRDARFSRCPSDSCSGVLRMTTASTGATEKALRASGRMTFTASTPTQGALPQGKCVWLYCAAGQRAYLAQRMLRQLGHDALNLFGGYKTWLARRAIGSSRA